MEHLIDKQRVAHSFSRAASTYDSVAGLQRGVGSELLEHIPKRLDPATVMDLGSGTGYFTPAIRARYPAAQLVNLDLALGMLQYARQQRYAEQTHWLCADAEALPLQDASLDLIFSSLAIQWCENLPALFQEVARVLRPGGCFVFATLGPQTLCELRQAWQQADSFTHVNQFLPFSELHSAFADELELSHFEEELKILKYGQLKELTDELKGLGAHNMNAGQQVGLTGRERVRRFKQAYEQQRLQDGSLPATYQVFYGVVTKSGQKESLYYGEA